MKLVRLISPADTTTSIGGQRADYYVNFQEPFEISPNSSISLQNFSITLDDQVSVSQNPKNDTFGIYSQDTANPLDATQSEIGLAKMTQASYQVNDFVAEVARATNAGMINPLSLNDDGTTAVDVDADDAVFIEWSCDYSSSKNLQINYFQRETTNDNNIIEANVNGDGASPETYDKAVSADANAWSFAYAEQESVFSKGQGYAEITLDEASTSVNGWAFGLATYTDLVAEDTSASSDPTEASEASFEPALYDYCIYTQTDTYWYSANGVQADTGIAVEAGDKIRMSSGRFRNSQAIPLVNALSQLKFFVERVGDPALEEIATFTNNLQLSNYYIAFSIQDAGVLLKGLRFTESHTSTKSTSPTASAKYYKLIFPTATQVLLGFTTRTTTPINKIDGTFTADLIIFSSIIPSSIAIEIPTLAIASYDGDELFQRRRSLIGVIPSTALNIENNSISYSQPYPVFLDIKNKATQLINSLRVRILDANNNPLIMSADVPKASSICVIFN